MAQHTPGPWDGFGRPIDSAEMTRRYKAYPAMVEALLYALPKDDLDEPLAPSVEAKIRAALAAAEGK